MSLSEALAQAIKNPGQQCEVSLSGAVDENDSVLVNVEFLEVADSVSTMHEAVGEVSIVITVDVAKHELRTRFLGLYVSFIQPDSAMREQVYGPDYRSMHLNMLVSQARLAQFLVTSETSHAPSPSTLPGPRMRHWAGQEDLTEAYIQGTVVQALCGEWFVPTRDGKSLPELPICSNCELTEPLAQQLQDLIRRLPAAD